MHRAICESNFPGRLPFEEEARRIAQWKRMGCTAVLVQVDGGTGACWPSSLLRPEPRVNLADEPLRRTVDAYHEAGLYVVLVFSVASYVTYSTPLIHPDFAEGAAPNLYNMWLPGFRAWRSDTIAECAAYVDADAIGLDYIRTGRLAQGDEAPAQDVILSFIGETRRKLDPAYALFSVTDPQVGLSQGVQPDVWLKQGLIDRAVLFNYLPRFATPWAVKLVNSVGGGEKFWCKASNYDMPGGAVMPRTGRAVAQDWKQIWRAIPDLGGIGIWNANQLNDDHVTHLRDARML